MTLLDAAGRIAEQCLKAISGITGEERGSLVDGISRARTIFVFGVGRSGLIAQTFAVRLVQLELKVYFIGDMTTPLIAADDLVILVSNSGDTMSVVKTAEIARRIGTPVISITSSRDNDLAHTSDMTIVIKADHDGCTAPLGTVFEDASLLFLDSIVPSLMEKLGATEEDMRSRHAIWV